MNKNFDETQAKPIEQIGLALLVLATLLFIAAEHGSEFIHKTRTAAAEWLCPENQTCKGKKNGN